MDPDAVEIMSGVSRGMFVLYRGRDLQRGRSSFWDELGPPSHCNQWGLCDAAHPKLLWAVLVMYKLPVA